MRARPRGGANDPGSDSSSGDEANPPPPPQPQQSVAQRAISQTLASTANLANLLPTGTLLAFQLLTPIFTSNGSCDAATGPMTFILLALLAFSCVAACFTDSFKSPQGTVHYGFVTTKGLWLIDYPYTDAQAQLPDLSKYKMRATDVVHAVLSVCIFLVVAFRDKNVISCFYPAPGHATQEVLSIAPVGVGLICSLLFVIFPTTRHGIGFPVTS
uniref:Uncharacterized protein n=1 Tax=Kalanchoe fedtschenkoi TaxID=63787 RepID=A0A7N0RFX4_KALFE